MGLLYGENCMILTLTAFDYSVFTRVTDRQTDRRTDGQTDRRNCDSIGALSIYAVARNKMAKTLGGYFEAHLFMLQLLPALSFWIRRVFRNSADEQTIQQNSNNLGRREMQKAISSTSQLKWKKFSWRSVFVPATYNYIDAMQYYRYMCKGVHIG